MFQRVIFCVVTVMLWSAESLAGQLSAKVEPQQIQFGDTVRLEVSYEGQDAGLIQPKFDVLGNDFIVYSTSSSMQVQYVNGVGQQKRVWTLVLMPQKEGTMVIPAISAGQYSTAQLNIEVLPTGVPTVKKTSQNAAKIVADNTDVTSANADFWMEMSADIKNPYLQQEVNTTLVIYDSKNIQFTEDPFFINADDWKIKQIGKPEITDKNGQRIIKIRYAMFPQKSGRLMLPAVQVKGYYIERSQNQTTKSVNGFFRFLDIGFDITDLTSQQKPIMMRTKPIEMKVKPIPEDYGNDWWLPATTVSLSARWSDERPVFKVGEAVTREITLSATGVDESQLPILEFAQNEAWKQYPENPVTVTVEQGRELRSTAVTRVVYIPQRGGEQIIPEIKLHWYNVKTHQIENAIIPAEKMYVGGMINDVASVARSATGASDAIPVASEKITEIHTDKKSGNSDLRLIILMIICAFLCGIICNYLFFRHRIVNNGERASDDSMSAITRNLRSADYRALRDSLMHWGEKMFKNNCINNLNDLAEQVKAPEFTEQMRLLNQNLYAGSNVPINAEIILKYVKKQQKSKATDKVAPLPDLYK
ncbi:MAG: protein BatD [Alphaproteobacteria bacterium]|nr:protein BatD [Alphaproteobacteria bacterium]